MRWKNLTFLFLLLVLLFKSISFIRAISWDITSTVKISVCGDGIIEGGEDCEGEDLNSQTCESLGFGPGTLTCDIACSFDTYDCSPAPTPTPTSTPTSTLTPTPTTTPSATPTPTLIPTTTSIPVPTPTPTLTLTPTPTLASTPTLLPTPTITPTNTPIPEPTSTPTSESTILVSAPTSTPTIAPTATPIPTPVLPPTVSFFDLDKSGRIEIVEVFAAVKSWVDNWQEVLKQEIISPQTTPEKVTKNCDLNNDERCDLKDLSVLLYYIGR